MNKNNIKIFSNFLSYINLNEDDFYKLPISEILDITRRFLGSVRRKDGSYYKQKSYRQLKWAVKKYVLDKKGYDIDTDAKLCQLVFL